MLEKGAQKQQSMLLRQHSKMCVLFGLFLTALIVLAGVAWYEYQPHSPLPSTKAIENSSQLINNTIVFLGIDLNTVIFITITSMVVLLLLILIAYLFRLTRGN